MHEISLLTVIVRNKVLKMYSGRFEGEDRAIKTLKIILLHREWWRESINKIFEQVLN